MIDHSLCVGLVKAGPEKYQNKRQFVAPPVGDSTKKLRRSLAKEMALQNIWNVDIILRTWLLYSKLGRGLYCFWCNLFRLGNAHFLFLAKSSITSLNLFRLWLALPTAFLGYWQKREKNFFFAKGLGLQLLWSWALEEGGAGGAIISKEGCFFNFEGQKTNFTTFDPFWKKVGKIPYCPPLEKILPMLMVVVKYIGQLSQCTLENYYRRWFYS